MANIGAPQAEYGMKDQIPALAVLLAGIILSAMVLAWWRTTAAAPSIVARVEVPGELAASPSPSAGAADAVRIGEHFRKFAGVPGKADGAWPGFRGINSDNIITGSQKLIGQWPEKGPPVLWSVKLGEGYAGPAILNGCVYVLDYDSGENADALRCFSMDDGREIWRRWYKVHVKRNHGMSRTVPAAAGRHVVTIGPRCHVMCVDAATGDFRWGIDLEKDWGAKVPMWYTGQCPLVDDGQAVIAVGGKALLIGVDCETGKVAWQTPNPRGWQMSHSSVVPMTIGGRKMYVYCALGGMVGVSAGEADRGSLLWETDAWNHAVVAPSPVSLGDGRIFMTSGYGVGSAMFKITEEAGRFSAKQLYRLEKNVFACEQHTPLFYKGCLFTVLPADAGPARRQAACMDPDGKTLWTSGSAERFGLGPFMIADDKMFILNDEGFLTMIEASAKGYVRLARARVLDGKEAWAPMALANGRLLVRDYGRMVCLDLRAEQEGSR
jgi:outer membrane protein assembly factor BamB